MPLWIVGTLKRYTYGRKYMIVMAMNTAWCACGLEKLSTLKRYTNQNQ